MCQAAGTIVTLVHGTWGRGIVPLSPDTTPKNWCHPESKFSNELRSALTQEQSSLVHITSSHWSGSNSIFAREAAARTLADHLDKQAELYPDHKRLIVSHSHGGNVALRSFNHLNNGATGLHVVTLATPFVESRGGNTSMSPAMRGVAIFLLFFAGPLQIYNLAINPEVRYWWVFLICMLGTVAFFAAFVGQADEFSNRLSVCSSHEAFRKASPPTLIIRGVDDEASFALAIGAITTRLSHVVASIVVTFLIVSRIMFLVALPSLVLIIVFNPNLMDYIYSEIFVPLNDYMWLTYVVMISLIVSLLLRGLAPAVFGRELYFTFADIFIVTSSSPDAGQHCTNITLTPQPIFGLKIRHSLYEHQDCVSTIASWFSDVSRPVGASGDFSGG